MIVVTCTSRTWDCDWVGQRKGPEAEATKKPCPNCGKPVKIREVKG